MTSQSKPSPKAPSLLNATERYPDEKAQHEAASSERLQEAIEKFKQDNKGKTWDDLANEHEAKVAAALK